MSSSRSTHDEHERKDAGEHAVEKAIDAEALLDEGLDLYGRGREKDAIAKWRRVLEIVPGEPRALDYLHTAGVVTPSAQVIPIHSRKAVEEPWRTEVVELVKARRYESALALLYRQRAEQPDEPQIVASIQSVKDHLSTQYAKELGGLDRVPVRGAAFSINEAEAHAVLRLVDGRSSYDDIASASPLGRFRTLKLLVRLFVSPASTAGDSSIPNSSVTPRPTAVSTPPPARSAESKMPAAKAEPTFDDLFRDATRAYLARRYAEAEALFEKCKSLKPDDARVRVSLVQLAKRREGT
ncbi:MAG: hypothetical protein IPK82_32950 [Polyangiaceae bacterium]|nr:hypothetical protein [Polyangiaceae bacterium]